MAKSKLSLADARSILANATSYGVDWTPAKAVSSYSAETARRYAGNIMAGVAPDRGHGKTPEHGKHREYIGTREVYVARNASDAAKLSTAHTHGSILSQRQATAQRAASERVIGRNADGVERLANGADRYHGHTKAVARAAARDALGRTGGESGDRAITGAARVQVVIYDKDGGKHTMGQKGGLNPKDVQAAMRGSGGMGASLAALASSIYGEDDEELGWEPSGEFDILVL
jgi:hypothetical protein